MPMFEAPSRRVDRIFLHCSASDDPALAGDMLVPAIRDWHIKRGFSDVGYHFLIDKRGRVMDGRPLSKIPAAQKGHNTGTIAIMVHGLEDFPEPMLAACARLCGQINAAYSGRISFHGHCEVSSKSCPVFDYRDLLKLDRWQRMP